jgi:gamma-glutamylcyclotransferase (GGCT)/AIG2-like uncharacterized protein YtfP
MASRLFIYGTLLLDDNVFAKYLRQHAALTATGKLKGYLYDTGNYPAAIADNKAHSFIHGAIVEFDDDNVLTTLDPYEGYGEGQPQPYLFLREIVDIETEKGIAKCWIYLYNHPTDNLALISSGDYLSYIKKKPSR